MPPFASLSNDEERERKAAHQPPGTYNVLVNPDSFANLPDYQQDSDTSLGSSPVRPTSTLHDFASSVRPLAHDPNWVLLDRFEEGSNNTPSQPRSEPDLGLAETVAPAPKPRRASEQIPKRLSISAPPPPPLRLVESQPEMGYLQPVVDLGYASHMGGMVAQPDPRLYMMDTTQSIPLPLHHQDLRNHSMQRMSYTTNSPRRVSIPLSSASGSLLEEIVGMASGNYRPPGTNEHGGQ